MLKLFQKKKERPELLPEASNKLYPGVYNRWKATYMGQKSNNDSFSCIRKTSEYFILTPLSKQTHIVRVIGNYDDSDELGKQQFNADYLEDSRIFDRSIREVTASDVMNSYPLTDFEQQWKRPKDKFGLIRVGTLNEFVEKIESGKLLF